MRRMPSIQRGRGLVETGRGQAADHPGPGQGVLLGSQALEQGGAVWVEQHSRADRRATEKQA